MNRRVAIAVLALLLLGLLIVPRAAHRTSTSGTTSTEAPATPTPNTPARVEPNGRVLLGEVTSSGGAPVAGARVTVRRSAGPSVVAVTGTDGQFAVDPLPDDVIDVVFSAAGHRAVTVPRTHLPEAPEAFWSQALEPEDGVVRVRVVVADGRRPPLVGARVLAVPPHGGARMLAVTEEHGLAAVAPADDEALWVVHDDHGAAPVPTPVRGPEVEIALPPSAAVDVEVVDEHGAGVAATVTLGRLDRDVPVAVQRALGPEAQGTTDPAGRGRIVFAAGAVRVTASAPGFRPRVENHLSFRPATSTTLRLALDRSPRVEGVVVEEGTGAPLAGAEVKVAALGVPAVITGRDGAFVLDCLPPRPVSVVVARDGFRSRTVGGVDGRQSHPGPLRVALARGRGRSEVSGIGITVDTRWEGPGLRVGGVPADTPAARAGIVAGDLIVAVDGERLDDDVEASMARVRGDPGSTVRLDVRGSDGRERSVDVERAAIVVPPPHRR